MSSPGANVAKVLAALANPLRLRLARLLLGEELCVCELVDALGIPQYEVSRHLSRLRRAGLVEGRRNGRWMYYSIRRQAKPNEFHQHLLRIIDGHLDGKPEARRDEARLSRRLALRQGGRCVVGTCR